MLVWPRNILFGSIGLFLAYLGFTGLVFPEIYTWKTVRFKKLRRLYLSFLYAFLIVSLLGMVILNCLGMFLLKSIPFDIRLLIIFGGWLFIWWFNCGPIGETLYCFQDLFEDVFLNGRVKMEATHWAKPWEGGKNWWYWGIVLSGSLTLLFTFEYLLLTKFISFPIAFLIQTILTYLKLVFVSWKFLSQ